MRTLGALLRLFYRIENRRRLILRNISIDITGGSFPTLLASALRHLSVENPQTQTNDDDDDDDDGWRSGSQVGRQQERQKTGSGKKSVELFQPHEKQNTIAQRQVRYETMLN